MDAKTRFGIMGLIFTLLLGSGGCGSTTTSTNVTRNPAARLEAISPNSSKLGEPGFTLSVVGSNFISGATVQWNETSLQTTFLSATYLTAEVPASVLSIAEPVAITVVNPAPSEGASNALDFALPCVIPAPTPASAQTRARLGAYFFDGWYGSLTNMHFQGLPFGPYQDRQPLSGWQDNTTCAIEQQLVWARNIGIDFFVFDWYFNAPVNDPGENLNSGLEITQSLPDRHGIHFAILYVDSPPFVIQPADWTAAIDQWMGYMTDPGYVLVNGKPLLVVYDMDMMRQTFGSSASVAGAFNDLRAAAQARGLPGVYVVGVMRTGYDPTTQIGSFPDLSTAVADGYDAVSLYGYGVGIVSGSQPFSMLSDAGHLVWAQVALGTPLPFVPIAQSGWDARPWQEGNVWFNRSPQEVTAFVSDAIAWANANPQLRPEPAPAPPLVLIEAWNEVGEGSYLIPTVGDGTSYGDSLAAMLVSK